MFGWRHEMLETYVPFHQSAISQTVLSSHCYLYVISSSAADGISIPASYTSYLAPITSSKLHASLSTSSPPSSSSHLAEARPAERPYVVMFSAFHTLSAAGGRLGVDKIQECWGFDHPRPDVVVDENGTCFFPFFGGDRQATDAIDCLVGIR